MSKISGIETHCAFDKSVDVVDLIPHPRNPNKHDDKQIALLAKIIRSQGWRNPIVVSERSGFIISGHGRLEAAKVLSVEQVPVDLQAFENEAEEYAHLIADNRIAELAETDRGELADLIRELDGEIDLDLTGFDEPSLAELMGESAPDGDEVDAEPQIDKADELQKKWNTALGQVWELGDHRLLCGDCTDESTVIELMGGEKVDVVYADPPYGINLKTDYSTMSTTKSKYKSITGDSDPFNASMIMGILKPAKWFLWGADYYCDTIPNYKDGGYIVWSKAQKDNENTVFGSRFELCWVWPKQKKEVWFVPGINQSTERTGAHPTQKPTSLATRAFGKEKADMIIVDPFLGSGTTLMACENLGRKCRAIEIDPGYVAVALERWSEATGKTPKLTDGA
jgi:DNA modification methylase